MAVVGGILAAFYLVAAAAAMTVFGTGVLPIVLVGSVLLIGVQYKIGKWAALRSVGAEDLPEDEYPQLHRTVESMSRDMGIEKPTLKIASMGVPNAFAVGRKGAGTVVVSRELLSTLDQNEVEGVLAHELAHIRNRDVVLMVLGQGIASIVAIVAQYAVLFTGDNDIADFFLAIVVGNVVQFIVMLFVMAISRYREYVADSDAKDVIGSGEPLASALEKIQRAAQGGGAGAGSSASGIGGGRTRGRRGRRGRSDDGLDKQVSALCIFGGDAGIEKILSTHPPVEKRIERLRS
ncbi:MAG: M48 family metallopeptidase [Halobacteriaceae archaeon]